MKTKALTKYEVFYISSLYHYSQWTIPRHFDVTNIDLWKYETNKMDNFIILWPYVAFTTTQQSNGIQISVILLYKCSAHLTVKWWTVKGPDFFPFQTHCADPCSDCNK